MQGRQRWESMVLSDTTGPGVGLPEGKQDISSCLLLLLSEDSVVTCHKEPSFTSALGPMEEAHLYFTSYINYRTLFFHWLQITLPVQKARVINRLRCVGWSLGFSLLQQLKEVVLQSDTVLNISNRCLFSISFKRIVSNSVLRSDRTNKQTSKASNQARLPCEGAINNYFLFQRFGF